MPVNTPDQQITMPVLPDAADNAVAFVNAVADIETRLVRRYTNEADRTARMLSLSENDISTLATENRADIYDGTNHISLFPRTLYANVFRTSDSAAVNNSTVLVNDPVMLVALPTAGRFQFDLTLFYDSSAAADIKFAFTWPAGAFARWGVNGPSTAVASGVGTTVFSTTTTSGAAIVLGGNGGGAANIVMALIRGTILMGGTAGNLQLQFAQQVAEATNTFIRSDTRMQVWRVA